MNVLITIPARAGSKGVPGKNIKLLAGKPLMSHAIQTALAIDADVIVTTNMILHDRYIDHRLTYYIRPEVLCTDTALAWGTWQDAVKAAQRLFRKSYDVFVYLEPTSPLRTAADVEYCIGGVISGEQSICTVSRAAHPSKVFELYRNKLYDDYNGVKYSDFLNNVPRQLLEGDFYAKNGICYACDTFRMKNGLTMVDENTYFIETDHPVVNIDTEEDFLYAEALLNAG